MSMMLEHLNGLVNFDITGLMIIAMFAAFRLTSLMVINILEILWDWLLLHLLISATWPLWELWSWIWEEHLLDQQELVKLNLSRILLKLWQNSVWCSTVLIRWTILWLVNSLKVLHQQEPGVVSMNSIVSILKCCRLLLNSCLFFLVKKAKELL